MFVFDREIVDNKLTCGDGRIERTKGEGEGEGEAMVTLRRSRT